MKRIWVLEADSVRDAGEILDETVVTTAAIKSFLDLDGPDTKFILSGPRGSGKTLLIKLKSKLYREQKLGMRFIPKEELCEKMYTANVSFSTETIALFEAEPVWSDIWSLTIGCTIVLHTPPDDLPPMPDELKQLLGDARAIPDILSKLLQNPRSFRRLQLFLTDFILPAVRRVREPVAVFIDSIDESFNNHIGRSYYDYAVHKRTYTGALDPKIWAFAQTGIIAAAKKLHQANRHVRVFAAIRCEALSMQEHPSLQDREYITEILYSKDDLRWILESNIARMPRDQLVQCEANALIQRFLGHTEIAHPFVTDGDNQPKVEDMFSYLLRHTFGRPREIILMGKRLAEINPADRDITRIREAVNSASINNLRSYENDILPFWDERLVRTTVGHVRANVMSRSRITSIAAAVAKEVEQDHPFCYLYQRGLIGYIARPEDNRTKKTQAFADAARCIGLNSQALPRSDYYVLHPALASDLYSRNAAFEFDEFNIVGDGYVFSAASLAQRIAPDHRALHVHFGAGRLGLGLCLPVLKHNHCVCIVYVLRRDSRSEARNLVKADGAVHDVEVDVNGRCHQIKACNIPRKTGMAGRAVSAAFDSWRDGNDVLLLLSDETSEFARQFVAASDSYSTAIKDGLTSLLPYFDAVRERKNRSLCYCFENDFAAVARFSEALSRIAPAIIVKKVISDRICSDVVFTASPEPWIYVHAESFHEAVVFDPEGDVSESFPENSNVALIGNPRAFEFFYCRKFWLLNGVHVLLAIAAYDKARKEGRSAKDAGEFSIPTLFDDEKLTEDLETFLLIQGTRLYFKHREILPVVYRGKSAAYIMGAIRMYGETLLSRLREFDDRVGRILPLDTVQIVQKFLTRVDDIREFVANDWNSLGSLNVTPPLERATAREFVERIALQMLDVSKHAKGALDKSPNAV